MNRRHIALMEHPLGAPDQAGIDANLARAERWLKWLLHTFANVDFSADWILWCRALDDLKPDHRARGLAFDDEMIRRVDAAWYVGGKLTKGMERGMATAHKEGKRVVNLTSLGDEPPPVFDREMVLRIEGILDKSGYKYMHANEEKKLIYLFATRQAYERALTAGLE